MKRSIGLVVTALGTLVLIALVAAPVAVTKPNADAAFGSGVRQPSCETCPPGIFSFNATSAPDGSNPSGTFVIDFTGFASFTASVSCLNVSGKTATFVGQIGSGTGDGDPSDPFWGGDPVYFVAVVADRGKARNKQPSPDQMSFVAWDTEAGWDGTGFTLAGLCADPFGALGATDMFGLVSGDLTVVDK